MVIAEVNTLANGSTGKIMLSLADIARRGGNVVYTFSSKNFRKRTQNIYREIYGHKYFGNEIGNIFHKCLGQITGLNGCFSIVATLNLIKELELKHVELVHLHNLHEFCINLPLLFHYIKKSGIKVVWTLHDCWAFTGHCPYFTAVMCDKWKKGCYSCPQLREYPKSYYDNTRLMWKLKRKWFTGINDLIIVTPSEWLAKLVKESFLGEYKVCVINNGINLSIFRPTKSTFRQKYCLESKYMVLGVAFEWEKRKGLDVFIELAHRLNGQYQIVLIGTDSYIDEMLPTNIISIHRTQNQQELAAIYSAANVFVNPTREDNYPTVNMEAIACGTPVVTFKTGGSPEIIDENTGVVVDCDDIDAMEREIIRICEGEEYTEKTCLKKALEFDDHKRFKEYVELYKTV